MQLQVAKEEAEEKVKGTQGDHLRSEYEINRLTKENGDLKTELENAKVGVMFIYCGSKVSIYE